MSTGPLFGSDLDSHDEYLLSCQENVEARIAAADDRDVAAENFGEQILEQHIVKPIALDKPEFSPVAEEKTRSRDSRQPERTVWIATIKVPYTSGGRLLMMRPDPNLAVEILRGGTVDDARWSSSDETPYIKLQRSFDPGTTSVDEIKTWREEAVHALCEVAEAINEKVDRHNGLLPGVVDRALEARTAELDKLAALNRDLSE